MMNLLRNVLGSRGLAPELLGLPYVCPWLTRTAGRRIVRPNILGVLLARFGQAAADFADRMMPELTRFQLAARRLGEAWEAFGAAVGKVQIDADR